MAVAIVPAAGEARRMGGRKLLLPFRGSTVLGSSLAALRGGGVDRIVVVAAADAELEREALAQGAEVVRNPAPERGMLSSVWEGLAALGGPARIAARGESLLVCPADLPALAASTVRAVREAVERGGARLALPVHGGRSGHPLAIAAGLATEIPGLDPATGLRQLRDRHRDAVELVAVDDPGCVHDVDTPESYRELTALEEDAMDPPLAGSSRHLLRHALATLAYRGGKAVRGVAAEVAGFRLGPATRTPLEILGHINDLLDWALGMCRGEHVWHDSHPIAWEAEAARFHATLAILDQRLAAAAPLGFPEEKLFQGPIADALTHVGQIALIRRLAGSPVRGENYFRAHIAVGEVGPDQPAAVREFD